MELLDQVIALYQLAPDGAIRPNRCPLSASVASLVQVFHPLLELALEQYYQTPVPEVLKSLFDAVNTADIAGAPRPTSWERALMRRWMKDTSVEVLKCCPDKTRCQ